MKTELELLKLLLKHIKLIGKENVYFYDWEALQKKGLCGLARLMCARDLMQQFELNDIEDFIITHRPKWGILYSYKYRHSNYFWTPGERWRRRIWLWYWIIRLYLKRIKNRYATKRGN